MSFEISWFAFPTQLKLKTRTTCWKRTRNANSQDKYVGFSVPVNVTCTTNRGITNHTIEWLWRIQVPLFYEMTRIRMGWWGNFWHFDRELWLSFRRSLRFSTFRIVQYKFGNRNESILWVKVGYFKTSHVSQIVIKCEFWKLGYRYWTVEHSVNIFTVYGKRHAWLFRDTKRVVMPFFLNNKI